MGAGIVVSRLALTPVKATRLHTLERIELGPDGARGNRRFFMIDERDRMLNGKVLGELTRVVADYDEDAQRLRMTFPDGRVVEGQVALGDVATVKFFSRTVQARLVDGPWSEALSDYQGRSLRLAAGDAVDRGERGTVSLISRGSLGRLAEAGSEPSVDGRRFRMLVEVDGVPAHAEDAWVGRTVQIGGATVRFNGHVGRCLITSRNPETGEVDLPTLDLLGSYRRDLDTTEPLPFGIYGGVVTPGNVAVGDPVIA
jgi:uncharacterized protein